MQRIQQFARVVALAGLVAASTSCGSVVRSGQSPVFLVINQLEGARGSTTVGTMSGTVESDVITIVQTPAPPCPCPTIFSDPGQVVLSIVPKDTGTAAAPTTPSTNNDVTITQYTVTYTRADGHNVQGVDVPYAFTGAATGTVAAGGTLTLGFELVRSNAKQESPLVELASNDGTIATIANVTFYGADLVGNAVSVTGQILIEFGNFGDF